MVDGIDDPAVRARSDEALDALFKAVLGLGGTISGEHGAGLSRTWFMREQFGPLYGVLREVKRIFDPENLFNPGRVVADLPQPIHNNLRPVEVAAALAPLSESSTVEDSYIEEPGNTDKPRITLQLAWSPDELVYTARTCNGCVSTSSSPQRPSPVTRVWWAHWIHRQGSPHDNGGWV